MVLSKESAMSGEWQSCPWHYILASQIKAMQMITHSQYIKASHLMTGAQSISSWVIHRYEKEIAYHHELTKALRRTGPKPTCHPTPTDIHRYSHTRKWRCKCTVCKVSQRQMIYVLYIVNGEVNRFLFKSHELSQQTVVLTLTMC